MCSACADFWRGCRWKRRVQRLVIATIASSTLSDSSEEMLANAGWNVIPPRCTLRFRDADVPGVIEHAREQMLHELHDAPDRGDATRRVVVARRGERRHRQGNEEQGNRRDLLHKPSMWPGGRCHWRAGPHR